MLRKSLLLLSVVLFVFSFMAIESCSSGSDKDNGDKDIKISQDKGYSDDKKKEKGESSTDEEVPESVKEGKGVGPVKNVELTDPLKEEWVKNGKAIHGKKCSGCHKLTDQRATGPGWEGITNKRKPEWIMNMIMNTDVMLEKDPEARKQLEECLTRMPNQELTKEEARNVLEFIRKNDLDKVDKKDQAVKS
jgi:mono/diheme cytochrome c family protein